MLTDSSDSLVATLYPQLKRLARDMLVRRYSDRRNAAFHRAGQ